jgi:VanZ family protein
MPRPVLSYATSLLNPTDRVRMQCLLLLAMLVGALLYAESDRPLPLVLSYLPWDKLLKAMQYGVLGALCWVVLGGRSPSGALVLAGSIALLDEGMKYYSPGRTDEFRDIAVELLGAAVVVLALRALKAADSRRAPSPRRPLERAPQPW